MKKPLYGAVLAEGYVTLVSTVMFYGSQFVNSEDSVIMPMAMLSLLVFSVAVMGYLFCYEPIALLVEGKKEEALVFFLKTIGYFGLMTVSIFAALFLFF
jgi:hypothetical protein